MPAEDCRSRMSVVPVVLNGILLLVVPKARVRSCVGQRLQPELGSSTRFGWCCDMLSTNNQVRKAVGVSG